MTDTLQKDWEWIVNVLHMSYTRALDGQRVRLVRPKGWSETIDIKSTMANGIIRQVKTIISTAEVVDAAE